MEERFEIRDARRKEMFRVDDEYLNGYARLCGVNATVVYLCLCRHAGRTQESFPSIKSMAEKTGISPRSVITAIKTLESWNIISKHRERRENKTWLNNNYVLMDKSVWKPKPSAGGAHGSQVQEVHYPSANNDKSQVQEVHTKDTHKKDTHTSESLRARGIVISSSPAETEERTRRPVILTDAKFKQVCSLFSPDCFALHRLDTTQRRAAKVLLEEKGFEAIAAAVAFAKEHKSEQYFPKILTPDSLLKNWFKLVDKVQDHAD